MTTYYVDKNATGGATGADWANALTTIQAGIDLATSVGDIIEVSKGTYAELIQSKYNGTVALPITIRASTHIDHIGTVTVDQYALTSASGATDILHDNIRIEGTLFYPLILQSDADVTRCVYQRAGAFNFQLTDVHVYAFEDFYSGELGFKAIRCKLIGMQGGSESPNAGVTGINLDKGGYFESCKVTAGVVNGTWRRPCKIRVRDVGGTGAVTYLNNCLLNGYFNAISDITDATATLELNNTLLGSYNWGIGTSLTAPIVFSSAGTVNSNNTQYTPYYKKQLFDLTQGVGTLNESNSVSDKPLKLTAIGAGIGGVCFTIDDAKASSMQYIADLIDELTFENGEVVTWFIDARVYTDALPSGYATPAALIQAAYDAGFEIASAGTTGDGMFGWSEADFKADLLDIKAQVETSLGISDVVKTHSYGGGETNTDMQTWVSEIGFIAARSSVVHGGLLDSVNLFSQHIWNSVGAPYHTVFQPSLDDASLQKQGVASAESSRAFGMNNCMLSHDAADLPLAYAVSWIKGAAKTGYLKTFRQLNEEYLAHPNTVAVDAINYTNTMEDITSDTLQSDADGVGTGTKWWDGANPSGINGEPFSDFDTDKGIIQSTFSPFHPVNL